MSDLDHLQPLFDTVIPAGDGWPAAWGGGVKDYVESNIGGVLAWARDSLSEAHHCAERLAMHSHGRGFADLTDAQRAQIWQDAMQGPDWPAFAALQQVCFEGYYAGSSDPVGWEMVGYRPIPDGVTPVDPDLPDRITARQLKNAYDVVVIGGGAGGGVVAGELAARGMRVLVVERSQPRRNSELRGDHLRGKRTARYEVVAGPGPGHPRVVNDTVIDGNVDASTWGLNAMALGGGTRLWQGMAWRFFREDFAMATTYGSPPDSTLADWPFGYDELAGYYDRVEWELGVSGSQGALTARTPRTRDYPMPPLPDDPIRLAFGAAADRLGWGWGPIPFALNSRPRGGRAACVQCSQCCGHACPVDAKNGSHNTFLPRGLCTGRLDLLMGAQAIRLDHQGGRARGLTVVVEEPEETLSRRIRAETFIVAAGAVETPRLLLASGMGNDWVGRNLHAHATAFVLATRAPALNRPDGPGHSVATLDFVHRDGEAFGGGVLCDLPPMLPVDATRLATAYGAPSFGLGHKRWMQEGQAGVVGIIGMGQEVPDVAARVRLDPSVADRYGMPVASLTSGPHPETVNVATYMIEHATTWLTEVGGSGILAYGTSTQSAAAGEHSAGTCRLGTDPATSACDERGRLHGVENVYVADASLHPTNGSVNPGLTTMANALRVADLRAKAHGA